jgi:hypothetical protein
MPGAEFAAVFRQTRTAFLQHENAKVELKSLVPEDAKEAIGHGIRAKRSKSGAISFDLLEIEARSAMPHWRVDSTSSARLWVSARSRPCRPRQSTRKPA